MAEPSAAVEWRGFGASATGTSHAERNRDCEDAHALVPLPGGGLVIAVADGAGSARRAEEGAWSAVEAAVAAVSDPGDEEPADPKAAIAAARRALQSLVDRQGQDGDADIDEADEGRRVPTLGDFACTLLVAVVRDHQVEVAQVGDGAIVVRRGSDLTVIAAGERGEFLNETCFITSNGWEADLREDKADGVDAVALMTDGLQMLALDMASGAPHAAFFEPLLKWASSKDPDGRDLVVFLGSDKVNERTDDDKTLVLAVAEA